MYSFIFRLRSNWLKSPDADSDQLFRVVAEIFILWCKSHVSTHGGPGLGVRGERYTSENFLIMFAFCSPNSELQEEQNFVIQNEINNLAFFNWDSKSKMSRKPVHNPIPRFSSLEPSYVSWVCGRISPYCVQVKPHKTNNLHCGFFENEPEETALK